MCKTKMAVNATQPSRISRAATATATKSTQPPSLSPSSSSMPPRATTESTQPPSPSSPSTSSVQPPLAKVSPPPSSSYPSTATTSVHYTSTSFRDSSSRTSLSSLSSLRSCLPETPNIYDISEIRTATNSFLAKNFSSSSSAASWRCSLRGKDVVVFQRKFRTSFEMARLRQILSVIRRSHHTSLIKLLGASVSGEHIYLVYDFVNGANLAACLRNPRNPNFTVLSTWMSRMQVATDIAHGLDYIHNNTGLSTSLVHKHIKSSSFIVTEPSFNAKICHFGTAQLCGEIPEDLAPESNSKGGGEINVEEEEELKKKMELSRSDSRRMQFEGIRGYMSPELKSTGIATQKSDLYAFGVVILELLTGEEPLKYKFSKETGEFMRTSVIDTATRAIDCGDDREREGRVRRWIDRRLKDSFPVEVAERITRVALECVHVEPDSRPDMSRVAGKISKLYLQSRKWSDRVKMPTEISVSLAPR